MGEKKLPRYLNESDLREKLGLTWSKNTLKRRIQSGFPAIQDEGGRLLFDADKVADYFKRREITPE